MHFPDPYPNMVQTNTRALLFWGVCIPLRLTLASQGDTRWLRVFAAVVSTRWLTGQEDGQMGMFGGPAWWADSRRLHGVLWGAYALSGNSRWLYSDTALGAVNWVIS